MEKNENLDGRGDKNKFIKSKAKVNGWKSVRLKKHGKQIEIMKVRWKNKAKADDNETENIAGQQLEENFTDKKNPFKATLIAFRNESLEIK